MARVNIGIIEISELKWTRMDEFNSDDHYIYYYGQKPLRRNGVALIVNKRIWNAVLGCNFQNDRMIVHFQGKPYNITVNQVYALTSNAEAAEFDWFYKDIQDLLEVTPPKNVLFIIGDCKSKKSRNTWSNGQIWPWSTEWSRAKFCQIEFGKTVCQENTLVIANTLSQQQKRRLYTWTSPDGQCRNQIDYILCSQRWRSSIQSRKTRLRSRTPYCQIQS